MVFASPIFLFLFLPLTLAAYFAFPQRWRNGVLLVASLAFYAWGEARYLPLIVGSVVFNWTLGRTIGRTPDGPARSRCSQPGNEDPQPLPLPPLSRSPFRSSGSSPSSWILRVSVLRPQPSHAAASIR